jgi:uncharacterized protein
MKWRKLNNILHRDFGYFFAALTIVYAISGISLNHLVDSGWNANYIVENKNFNVSLPSDKTQITKNLIIDLLKKNGEENVFRKFYYPTETTLKVFIKDGTMLIDLTTGKCEIERLHRRPFFHQFNFLHYNSARKLWTWFADLFAVGLILLAVTGLFVLKGKNGITGRGAWMTALGIIIPLVLFFLYY